MATQDWSVVAILSASAQLVLAVATLVYVLKVQRKAGEIEKNVNGPVKDLALRTGDLLTHLQAERLDKQLDQDKPTEFKNPFPLE